MWSGIQGMVKDGDIEMEVVRVYLESQYYQKVKSYQVPKPTVNRSDSHSTTYSLLRLGQDTNFSVPQLSHLDRGILMVNTYISGSALKVLMHAKLLE